MATTLGAKWLDSQSQPVLVDGVHSFGRFQDVLDTFIADVEAKLVSDPFGSSVTDGPPTPHADLKVTSWYSGGVLVWVATERNSGEGDTEFAARHDAQVSATQELLPED